MDRGAKVMALAWGLLGLGMLGSGCRQERSEAERKADILIEDLHNPATDRRRSAAEELGKMRHAGAVDALVETLRDVREEVRMAAVEALGRIASPEALRPLTAMAGTGDWPVRKAVVVALGRLGDPRAVPALVKALSDQNEAVRMAAGYALGGVGAPGIEALRGALNASDDALRRAAVTVLGRLGDKGSAESFRAMHGSRRPYSASSATRMPASAWPPSSSSGDSTSRPEGAAPSRRPSSGTRTRRWRRSGTWRATTPDRPSIR